MRTQVPTAQQLAGHIPADLIPQGADPRTVVIVQQAPRSYSGPLLLTFAVTLGSAVVIYMLMLLVQTTADAAADLAKVASAVGGVGVGGVTFKLARGGKR